MDRRSLLAQSTQMGGIFPISLSKGEIATMDLFEKLKGYIIDNGEDLSGVGELYLYNLKDDEKITIRSRGTDYEIKMCNASAYNYNFTIIMYPNTTYDYPYFQFSEQDLKIQELD